MYGNVAWLRSLENYKTTSNPKFSRIWWIFYTVWSNSRNFISISSIGKILYGRGAVYLLSEAKMIAGGSTNTFLRGKLLCKCNAWFASWNMYCGNQLFSCRNFETGQMGENMSKAPSNLQDIVTKHDSYLGRNIMLFRCPFVP